MNRVSGWGPANSTGVVRCCGGWFAVLLLVLLINAASAGQIELNGEIRQGGMVVGHAPHAVEVWQDGQPVRLGSDGLFLLGFGRDAPQRSQLKVKFADGEQQVRNLTVAKRDYRIQRIDGLPPGKVTPRSEEDLKRIREDVAAVRKARSLDDARTDFLTGFIWPVKGRISGVYGSQRILNGKPRRPHFGVDIARPTGTPVVAPADGIVTLAVPDMFFSGGTMIIDHGYQLSSSFLHLSKLIAKPGQHVKQGEVVAEVGATGRVTGAHLDWRMNLRDKRIDPALLAPPMDWQASR